MIRRAGGGIAAIALMASGGAYATFASQASAPARVSVAPEAVADPATPIDEPLGWVGQEPPPAPNPPPVPKSEEVPLPDTGSSVPSSPPDSVPATNGETADTLVPAPTAVDLLPDDPGPGWFAPDGELAADPPNSLPDHPAPDAPAPDGPAPDGPAPADPATGPVTDPVGEQVPEAPTDGVGPVPAPIGMGPFP